MNTHCDAELSAYLDGELDHAAQIAVESHLAECAACRTVLEGLRAVTRQARALDDRPPERDLWSGIASRIGAAEESRKKFSKKY